MKSGTRTDSALEGAGVDLNFVHLLCNLDYLGRLCKGVGDASVHTGSLWSSNGTLLRTGTFSGESASGWQQLDFSVPVAITANTTYIASYHSGGPTYYSYSYFQNAGVDNAPLHALKDGVDGPNGVFVYGSGGVFPNQTYAAANYWVDVIFTTP